MATVDARWTIGREGSDRFSESLAGKPYPKAKLHINGFDEEGKLLPVMTIDDAGNVAAVDKNVMNNSFRLCLTENPNNNVPLPKLANYDPVREFSRSHVGAQSGNQNHLAQNTTSFPSKRGKRM